MGGNAQRFADMPAGLLRGGKQRREIRFLRNARLFRRFGEGAAVPKLCGPVHAGIHPGGVRLQKPFPGAEQRFPRGQIRPPEQIKRPHGVCGAVRPPGGDGCEGQRGKQHDRQRFELPEGQGRPGKGARQERRQLRRPHVAAG